MLPSATAKPATIGLVVLRSRCRPPTVLGFRPPGESIWLVCPGPAPRWAQSPGLTAAPAEEAIASASTAALVVARPAVIRFIATFFVGRSRVDRPPAGSAWQ